MKNLAIFSITIVALIVLGIFFYGSAQAPQTQEISTGDAQQITLSMKNGNYYPNAITVKANQPVEVTLDNSVGGCFRSFTVRELGVRGLSRSPSEKIRFTPTEEGTFTFACSMGMGYGQLNVVQ
ncbi:MAG: cupredoxin domain-containing protein [Nanoarchaeota archaeon]